MPSPSGGLSVTLDFDRRNLGRNLEALPDEVDGMVHAVMEYQSVKAVAHMKTTAPWTDRTGNARNGLSSEVGWNPRESHSIRLFHRMWYGIFLETRWAGRYAIILPTIQLYGKDTMRLLTKLFQRLGR